MNTRPSLGFDDDDAPVETKPSVVSLDDFKPTPVKRPAKEQVAEAAEKAAFRSREPKPTPVAVATPPKIDRRRRTGRTAQLNLKAKPETIEQFYAIADAHGWGLGEAFEHAVARLAEAKQ